MRPRITALVTLVALLANLAVAGPFKATINFPEGLTPGQEVPVFATLEGELETLKDVPVAVVYEAGQDGLSQQVELGKIGGDLQGKLTPQPGPARLTIRFSNAGKNYAQVAELAPGQTSAEFEFNSGEPSTRAFAPFVQVLLWVIGAVALGFYALRGLKPAF